MARHWRFPLLLFAIACTTCGGHQTSDAVRSGLPCEERNAKAMGSTGCDLCTCVEGHWSCDDSRDCTCARGDISVLGDGCTTCPCKDGKFRCTYQPCLACPPPRTDQSCAAGRVWARDPSSGVCCEYDKVCEARIGWSTHANAAECNPFGCSCDYTPGAPPQPIGCACPISGCPTLTEVLSEPCGIEEIPIIQRRGCGKVELSYFGGFSGWNLLFDERTGAIIGGVKGGDTNHGVCNRFRYAFGEEFDCAEVSECAQCPDLDDPTSPPACSP